MTDRTDADDLDLQRVGARLAARAQIRDIRAAAHSGPLSIVRPSLRRA